MEKVYYQLITDRDMIIFEANQDRKEYIKILEAANADVIVTKNLTKEQFIELVNSTEEFKIVKADRYRTTKQLKEQIKNL